MIWLSRWWKNLASFWFISNLRHSSKTFFTQELAERIPDDFRLRNEVIKTAFNETEPERNLLRLYLMWKKMQRWTILTRSDAKALRYDLRTEGSNSAFSPVHHGPKHKTGAKPGFTLMFLINNIWLIDWWVTSYLT